MSWSVTVSALPADEVVDAMIKQADESVDQEQLNMALDLIEEVCEKLVFVGYASCNGHAGEEAYNVSVSVSGKRRF